VTEREIQARLKRLLDEFASLHTAADALSDASFRWRMKSQPTSCLML
jgi:hypothetical protein